MEEKTNIIQFFDVYVDRNTEGLLIVVINGSHHKAIETSLVSPAMKVFDHRAIKEESKTDFGVNPNNATQLMYNGVAYQVTMEPVSEDSLTDFVAVIQRRTHKN